MPGSSKSARHRQEMKEKEPERYRELLRRQNERYKRRKAEREEYWASGTRQSLEDREEYIKKRRAINRKSAKTKKDADSSVRSRRSSVTATEEAPRVSRQLMLPEERKAHDNLRRRECRFKKSRQKLAVDKKAHAKYMRQWRLLKKGNLLDQPPSEIPTLGSSVTESPIVSPGPSTARPISTPGPSSADSPPRTSTPISQSGPGYTTPTRPLLRRNEGRVNLFISPPSKALKMRQHCYNTTAKMKSLLKKSFTDEESAKISANLILRKTPEKRKQNMDQLLEDPEVRAYCRKNLKKPDPSHPTRPDTRQLILKRQKTKRGRFALTKVDIMKFFMNPAVARVLPHRRYATKRGPGYIMMVTIKRAHQLYEEFSKKPVSFSLFASLRPRNVRKLGTVPVETCLCVTCTNVKLKIDALNGLLGVEKALMPEGKLFKFLLCPFKGSWPSKDCITGDCFRCADKIRPFTTKCWDHFYNDIKWFHWERRDVDGKQKLDIHPYHGAVSDLLEQLRKDLDAPTKGTSFVQHLFTAYWQQSQYDAAKESLRRGQVLMLQDFAENRKATYHAEVKSAHFGKAQISLHPSVAFYKNSDGHLVRHVAMFFSDDIGHDYHAVHCYTKKAIELVKEETTVEEVILWSDGAASQYKGKGTFADLSLYQLPIQRNFFGSEHGKGEADGETGRFSQAMARAVAGGHNFATAKDMVEYGAATYTSDALKKYSFLLVEKEEIERERPTTDVATLPGTRSLHQISRKADYVLAARKLSCFCCGCVAGKMECCINKEYVDAVDIFKLKPRQIQVETQVVDALPVSEVVEEPEMDVPTFTSSKYPSVGKWLEIVGSVEVKGGKAKTRQEKSYFANVVAAPDGANKDHFYVQFYKGTASGSYVHVERAYQIVPGTSENYRWRIIEAPRTNARGHFFFL